jgi:hypothetical protein
MIIALILATASASMIVFLTGYKLGIKHSMEDLHRLELQMALDNATGSPIHAALDREWKYTEKLNRPFTDD